MSNDNFDFDFGESEREMPKKQKKKKVGKTKRKREGNGYRMAELILKWITFEIQTIQIKKERKSFKKT